MACSNEFFTADLRCGFFFVDFRFALYFSVICHEANRNRTLSQGQADSLRGELKRLEDGCKELLKEGL